MAVAETEGEPAIGIIPVGSGPKYQKAAARFNKSPNSGGGGFQSREEIGEPGVGKSGRYNEGYKFPAEKRCGDHLRGDQFTGNAALFDIPREQDLLIPHDGRTANQPFITPRGVKRATSREIPAS
jgi:hypothetical protein